MTADRLDASIRRLLRLKFDLGLFDDPYVDEDAAEHIVGRRDFVAAGEAAQRRSLTLLKNNGQVLPLRRGARVHAPDLDPAVVADYGVPVADPAEADVAVVRLRAPFEQRDTYFLEARFHAGRLDFDQSTLAKIADLARTVPVVVDLYLDRPAVLGTIADDAASIVVSYGCSAAALLDVLFGAATAEGRLPFDLPRSMDAVRAGHPDLPSDDPLFRCGSSAALPVPPQ